ncbi:MAG: ABC transporter permease subunit [Cyanobacteriota bacterium]|nr:ABC transporter permease subunit [Cyanobacteriota bacterium]
MALPIPWWRNKALIPWLVQAVFGLAVLVVVCWLASNLVRNLGNAGLLLSWRWLGTPAGFDLGESPIGFVASQPYWLALVSGLLNSLRVIVAGLVGATCLGTAIGIASFSSNTLLRQLARLDVELIRNIPLLLQLLFWYFVVFLSLPDGPGALQLPGMVLAKSGLVLGQPVLQNGSWSGAVQLSIEFMALFTGLVIYTSAFIAEVVRGGVLAVPPGQWEAARSLGLKPRQILGHIVLPQALRVILPGLNNQYISLAKNSSLAVAVGYSDLYSVAETTLNQTGRGVEVVLILLGSYLLIDLLISALMNGLNHLVQRRER